MCTWEESYNQYACSFSFQIFLVPTYIPDLKSSTLKQPTWFSLISLFSPVRANVGDILDNRTSSKIHLVTEAMEHALLSWWPKTRYAVGWDAKFLWIPLSYLPNIISDSIIGMNGFPIIKNNRWERLQVDSWTGCGLLAIQGWAELHPRYSPDYIPVAARLWPSGLITIISAVDVRVQLNLLQRPWDLK